MDLTPSAPQRIGRYAVRRRLGSGAFATVWLAYDAQLDSPVAVKVLADNWAGDAQVRARFLEEGRYLRRVESPHVVSVYDAGELPDGRPYLVMSYADQGTLGDRLDAGSLTTGQAMVVLRQVGAGLQALHDRDILHRDVKPANVLFRSRKGEVCAMLGDLGLGKALDASSRLTMAAGTPSYVAPEQARAESLDARADQFSFGALAYLLLGGRSAYSHADLKQAANPAAPAPLASSDGGFGEGGDERVDAVVRRAMAIERDDRWPDVATFVTALDDAVTGSVGSRVEEPVDTIVAQPWLPFDPDATAAGAAPSLGTGATDPAASDPPRRARRRLLGVLAVLVLLPFAGGAGAVGGQEIARETAPTTAQITDDTGRLEVTVPHDWTTAVGTGAWQAPQDEQDYPAVSAGTATDWTDAEASGQGVFAGLMPGSGLPGQLPGHPECSGTPSTSAEGGSQPSTTRVFSGCPDGVVVERVEQVSSERLLWVQVRSQTTGTAYRVLSSVTTYGY
ncbi:serine/threonine-protein kinase [Nocardioides acrostichi]|uniref:non-specific serine/threonine protein kinase n=1 Tax=Nocardioides acrostichi TaxID=2784339 RepID=A0A930V011_9ACTN|nr:serine/threonine-protein kinase [Nocardioides acrostichi]MBF4161205.1 serine/threonine protein kinase [Nocardioides acrostichi]